MHLIRRSALRAAGSASTSFTSAPRSFATTSSPFLARSRVQSALSPSVFRRFSDEAKPVESADADESSTIQSAIESSSESTTGGFAAEESRNDFYNNDRGSRGNSSYAGNRRNEGERFGTSRPRPDRDLSPTNGVYIGNLLFEVTAADLQKEFEQFGPVKSSTLATDSRGLSKGFGYIQFETVEQAKAAIEAKNQAVFEGRRLVVNYMAKTSRSQRDSNPPSKTLFIGNLAFEMSDADLNKLFRDIRNVLDVRVAIDRRTGQPRGFAHADFVDVDSATKGKEALQGQEVYGRTLRVDYSGSKERPRGDGRSEGRGDRGDRGGEASF